MPRSPLEPEVPIAPRPLQRSRSRRRWTLLLVSDDGRLRYTSHLKTILIVGAAALAAAVGACVGVFGLYSGARHDATRLAEALEEKQRALAAENEKVQLLLARSVIAENENAGTVPAKSAGQDAAGLSDRSTKPSRPSVESLPVKAQEFSLDYEKGGRQFRIAFKLTGKASEKEPVAGYVFVVFSSDDADTDVAAAVIPNAPLEADRPVNYKAGRPFSITRYTTIRLDGRLTDGDLSLFSTATVIIYGKNGELLLEQPFSVGEKESSGKGR